MQNLIELARRANFGALIAVGAIYVALLARGANTAALAALFACVMLALTGASVLAAGRRNVARVVAETWLPAAAALGFVGYAVFSAVPGLPTLLGMPQLAHPLGLEVAGAGAAISLSPYRTLEGAAAFLGPACAFALGALAAPKREARDWAGRWIVILSIPYSLLGVAMFFNSGAYQSARLDIGLDSANAAATVLGMVILVAGALIMRAGSGRFDGGDAAAALPEGFQWARYLVSAPFSVTALVLAFACLMLTASRGGLVALAVAIVVFGASLAYGEARSRRSTRGSLIIPFLAVAAIAAFLFHRGGDLLLDRFAAASQSAADRRELLAVHWQAFLERPTWGHGLNTFHELNSLAGTSENWAVIGSAGAAHNIVVQLLEETGFVGAALFLLMLGPSLLRAAGRLTAGASGVEWSACALALAAFCLVHGMVDFGLQVPAIAALFAFALGALVGERARRREPEPAAAAAEESEARGSFRFTAGAK